MKLMGTQLNLSTAFHPQSDGQTERANRTLEEMLRSYVSYRQNDWDLFLPALEFAYNNSKNPSTGFTPFFLNHGYDPIVPSALLKPPVTPAPAVSDFVSAQASALAQAKDAIIAAQDRQKHQADKSRRPAPFKVGDKVLLSTEHISIAAHRNRPSKKLEPQAIGPFEIIAKHNDNAFELDLPPTMKHYPVFNADLLRPYHESLPEFSHRTPPKPPPEIVNGQEEWEVEEILDYKIIGRTPKWLVKWKGYSEDDATWEPRRNLVNASEAIAQFEAKQKEEER